MSDQDPAERWRELDESTRPRARSRRPPRPEPPPTSAPGPVAGSGSGPVAEPVAAPEPGPSPYEAYPWAAVDGSPLSPTQAPFPAPSPYGAAGWARPTFPVQHPSAATALTLGLVGTIGGAACWAPLLASPVALSVGRRALREIDASNGTLTGRGAARAGAVLGGIGTAALVALVLGLIVFVVV